MVAITVAAFVADWLLTVAGARAYVAVRDRWSVEGSYEMNPSWVASVESGRWVTLRVVAVAGLVALLLGGVWLAGTYLEDLYPTDSGIAVMFFSLGAGALLLVQAPTLMNHVRNLTQFRSMSDPTAVTGQLRVSRWLALSQVSWIYLDFAVLWLLLWVVSLQAFFLGGVIGSLVVGLRFRRLADEARRARQIPTAAGTVSEFPRFPPAT